MRPLPPGVRRTAGRWGATVLCPTGTALFVDGQQVATGTAASVTTASLYVRLAWDSLAGWPSAPANTFFAGSLAHASLCPGA